MNKEFDGFLNFPENYCIYFPFKRIFSKADSKNNMKELNEQIIGQVS